MVAFIGSKEKDDVMLTASLGDLCPVVPMSRCDILNSGAVGCHGCIRMGGSVGLGEKFAA